MPWMRPLDERGWAIPAEGTNARLVYGLMVYGLEPHEIAEEMGVTRNYVRVVSYKIRHPELRRKLIRNKPCTTCKVELADPPDPICIYCKARINHKISRYLQNKRFKCQSRK